MDRDAGKGASETKGANVTGELVGGGRIEGKDRVGEEVAIWRVGDEDGESVGTSVGTAGQTSLGGGSNSVWSTRKKEMSVDSQLSCEAGFPSITYKVYPSCTISFVNDRVDTTIIGKWNSENIYDRLAFDICCENVELQDFRSICRFTTSMYYWFKYEWVAFVKTSRNISLINSCRVLIYFYNINMVYFRLKRYMQSIGNLSNECMRSLFVE
jgi:hypothetical protein